MPERYTPEEMDQFAEEAGLQLDDLSKKVDISLVADWVQNNFMKCGYRRLGRLLREYRSNKTIETKD